jgi:hypothetical protein
MALWSWSANGCVVRGCSPSCKSQSSSWSMFTTTVLLVGGCWPPLSRDDGGLYRCCFFTVSDATQELTRALQEIIDLRTAALNASETKVGTILHTTASLEHTKELLRDALCRLQAATPPSRPPQLSDAQAGDDKHTAAAARRLHVRKSSWHARKQRCVVVSLVSLRRSCHNPPRCTESRLRRTRIMSGSWKPPYLLDRPGSRISKPS